MTSTWDKAAFNVDVSLFSFERSVDLSLSNQLDAILSFELVHHKVKNTVTVTKFMSEHLF